MAKVESKHRTQTAESFVKETGGFANSENSETAGSAEIGGASETDPSIAPEGWVEEQTGFPPYWTPEITGKVGSGFRAVPLAIDLREPEFVRYILRATVQVSCWKGPTDDQEEVTVEAGQTFSCSAYAALRLDQYFGHEVMVVTTGKRDLKGGKQLWQFRVFVSPQTRKLLDKERAEHAKLAAAEAKKAPF